MSKKYFLSHSSKNKTIVSSIADSIGRANCWLDEWDLYKGDELFSQIDQAIATVEVFVIFWSQHASKSPWVAEELAQARYRKLVAGDVRVIPVLLDDTPLPVWLKRLVAVYAQREDATRVATILQNDVIDSASAATTKVIPSSLSSSSSFQDRLEELEIVERAYLDSSISGLLVTGLPGMGKSSFIQYSLTKALPHLRIIYIDFDYFNTPARFYSALANRFGVQLPDTYFISSNWDEYWLEWICPLVLPQTDVFVLDNFHSVYSASDEIPEWLYSPFSFLCSQPGPERLPIIVASSRYLSLPAKSSSLASIRLSRLSSSDIIRCIRARFSLCHPRIDASQKQLEDASALIQGYPLGATLWTGYAARSGILVALADPSPLQEQVREVVADIVGRLLLAPEEQEVLFLLSLTKRPIPFKDIASLLGKGVEALASLQKAMVVEADGSDNLSVHSFVAKYVSEHLMPHDRARKLHSRIGTYYLNLWRSCKDEGIVATVYGSQAYYHLVSAGRIAEASIVKIGVIEEAASAVKELYRTKKDNDVIDIGTELVRELGDSVSAEIGFYLALSLGRRGDKEKGDHPKSIDIFDRLIADHPHNRYYWSAKGDILARQSENEKAKEAYMKARALAGDRDPVPCQRLGELLLREKNLKEARTFLEEALRKGPKDIYVTIGFIRLLEAEGNEAEAMKKAREALHRWPEDVALNHTAGQLFKEAGNYTEAESHLKRACGPRSPASYTSLADMYLGMGREKDAAAVMARYQAQKNGTYYNVMANICRKNEHFIEAHEHLRKCFKSDGGTLQYYGSLAQLLLEEARKANEGGAYEEAKAKIVEADEAIERGLQKEENNRGLLEKKKETDELRKETLRKSREAVLKKR
jgi:tetratricopeptide (TPR) repeat protein